MRVEVIIKIHHKGGAQAMEKNMSTIDRGLRVVLALIFLYLAFTKGGAWWILGIVGIVFIGTSVMGFCPLYRVIGMKTG
ncbi:MAG: DUF2892 domain-containing protein [Aquificaceae bacterium]|nr:DUF2892 domain-containing protein [Aquificaceae bacterium]